MSPKYDQTGTEDQLAFMLYFTTKRTDYAEQTIRQEMNRLAQEAIRLGGKPYLAYAKMLDTDVIKEAYPELCINTSGRYLPQICIEDRTR